MPNTEAAEIIEELADFLEEAHLEEILGGHAGDRPEACSYCRAIARARTWRAE
jgi:hypothetical protein